jgi:hypothetical protein
LIILSLQAALSLVFVFFRTVDLDEGFYLAAAQRVADGMTLYADFFFPQMPLFPLVFSALSGWGMTSLLILRGLAAVAGLLCTWQAYSIVQRSTEDRNAALIAAFLVAFSGISLAWHATFKPYAFIDFFLLLSFGALLRLEAEERFSYRYLFLSLFSLAVAFNFRSVFVAVIPFHLYFIVKALGRGGGSIGKVLLVAGAALAIPSIPTFVLMWKSPASFWFNNLVFHLHRGPVVPMSEVILQKLRSVVRFLATPQAVLLLGAILGSLYLAKKKLTKWRRLYRYALIMAAIISVVYLAPTPILVQYFQQTMPYLSIAAVPTVLFFGRTPLLKRSLKSGAVLYLLGILPFVYTFILVPHPRDERFEMPQLRNVIGQIQQRSTENDTLLCEWPGYAALAERAQLPGSEFAGFYFPLNLEPEAYRRNHLLMNDDIVVALNQQRPALVLVDFQIYPEWKDALLGNYHLAYNVAETSIYERNHAAP